MRPGSGSNAKWYGNTLSVFNSCCTWLRECVSNFTKGDLESFEHALHRVEAQQKLVQVCCEFFLLLTFVIFGQGRREKEAAQEATKLEVQQKAQAERAAAREKSTSSSCCKSSFHFIFRASHTALQRDL